MTYDDDRKKQLDEWEAFIREEVDKMFGTTKPKPSECWHDWVEYVGLTEKYFYCRKCDSKYTPDSK